MRVKDPARRFENRAKKAVKRQLARRGFALVERKDSDMEPEFWKLYERCANETMTGVERMYALWKAVRHVVERDIPGDIVECGVWRGGSSMLCALTLAELGATDRRIFLYDTFEGMSEPTPHDVTLDGVDAREVWEQSQRETHNDWCYASLDVVRENMASTGFPLDRIELVRGKVEDTIPGVRPDRVAVLRLDTDWYESTLHELRHLYPHLSPGGVLVIDDYGAWAGARQAVDEYFGQESPAVLLNRLDYTGRIAIKV